MSWRIEAFNPKRHDRTEFSCGVQALTPHGRRGVSRTFVAVDNEAQGNSLSKAVRGFYTLSAGHVEFGDYPDALRRQLPKYPVPVALIGQLAVDRSVQGQGLGAALLYDALLRVLEVAHSIGIVAVLVEAIDAPALRFYRHHGFVALDGYPDKLVLPLGSIPVA